LKLLGWRKLEELTVNMGGDLPAQTIFAALKTTSSPSAGAAGPGAVASGLPQRAVEPSRPEPAPADTGKPREDDWLIKGLREAGANAVHGDARGVIVVDGKRMSTLVAQEHLGKLRRRRSREAAA
jgi:hypothetical protein